jgi:hypothetical protein
MLPILREGHSQYQISAFVHSSFVFSTLPELLPK